MTKKRSYTRLTPRQRLTLCQMVIDFPDASPKALADVAGVSVGTVYNVARPVLETVGFDKNDG